MNFACLSNHFNNFFDTSFMKIEFIIRSVFFWIPFELKFVDGFDLKRESSINWLGHINSFNKFWKSQKEKKKVKDQVKVKFLPFPGRIFLMIFDFSFNTISMQFISLMTDCFGILNWYVQFFVFFNKLDGFRPHSHIVLYI